MTGGHTRPAVNADVRAELDAHFEARVEDNLRRGMSMADALREATRRLGPRDEFEVASTKIRNRRPGFPRSFGSDLREVSRRLLRRPAATICGLLVAATGLTTTLASTRLIDALLVRPPAGVERPGELYSVLDWFGSGPGFLPFNAFVAMSSALPEAGFFAWDRREVQMAGAAGVRPGNATVATGSYFSTLGLHPKYGRLLNAADDDGARPMAVASYQLASSLAGDPANAVGRPIRVNGVVFEICGVTPPGFHGLESGHPSDLWLPMSMEPAISTPTIFPDGHRVQGFRNTPGIGWLRLGMRRPAGWTLPESAARVTAVLRGPAVQQYDRYKDRKALVTPRIWLPPFADAKSRLDSVMKLASSAGLMTLLLTAACLGSIFAGRQSDRAREISLRLALGASRARLLRLAALEVAVIVSGGAAISLMASSLVLNAAGRLQLMSGVTVDDAMSTMIDSRGMLTVLLLAAIVASLSAVAPVLLVAGLTKFWRVESTRSTAGGRRLRRFLLVAQVAAGCAFLCGAMLLTRSISALRSQPLGYEAATTAYAELDPAGAGLSEADRAALVERLGHTTTGAGVRFAFADQAPYTGGAQMFVTAEGSEKTQQIALPTSRVSASYFETLGIPIVAGRAFSAADSGRRFAIVSETTAKYYWPAKSAIGQKLRVGFGSGGSYEIVGVAAGIRDAGLKGLPGPRVYLPIAADADQLVLVARGAGARPSDTGAALASIAAAADSRLHVLRTGLLIDLAWRTIEQRMLIRFVVMTIGIGSLLMVTAGVWGLSHSSLRRRWREFGIRQALGATRAQVSRLAFADAAIVSLGGAACGLAASWGIGALLQTWLFGVRPHDPISMTVSTLIVTAAGFAGAALPAREAGRADPAILLRDDGF